MIKSMTGYGKAEQTVKDFIVKVEVRSLNSKFLDVNMRLPQNFREKEMMLRNLLSEKLLRGKIDCTVTVEYSGAQKVFSINRKLAIGYFNELNTLAEELKQPKEHLLASVLKLPDVIAAGKNENIEEEWTHLTEAINNALNEHDDFRKQEGKTLEKEFKNMISVILDLLTKVESFESERTETIQSRLQQNLEKNIGEEKIDKNRFEQELIYYLERMDFTEEKVRLRSHCNFFLKTMEEQDSNGRKLGFISQEIGREINTLGSKASHADIQKIVVQMKDELEKIKEQLLNIL